MVPEGRGIFARLSVAENLDLGAYIRRDRAAIQKDLERVYTIFPRLKERHATRCPGRFPAVSSRCSQPDVP
jgi:branched-chain amino acid transport system ATP-binding protein